MRKRVTLQIVAVLCGLQMLGYAEKAETHTLNAMVDFTAIENGDAPYYKDIRYRSLAINAQNRDYREKWARAETRFSGTEGTFKVTLTTLTEKDGESTYRLLIDGKEIGIFVNPATTRSFTPTEHTWSDIELVHGNTIAIESISHTNGKIKARTGSTWSRGRWRSLTLTRIN